MDIDETSADRTAPARAAAAWAAASLTALALDMAWLGGAAAGFYRRQAGHLMAERPDPLAAGAFYLLYGWGVWFFAVRAERARAGARHAALRGALLGLFAYGTYDLTNLAVLKGWPPLLAFVDMAWGGLLTAASAAAASAAGGRRRPGRELP